jgi:predicted RNA-binding protein with PUA-like domain
MACWLLKTEPDTFSLEDLAARPTQTEPWDGVRNYQARNFLRDGMQAGDDVLIYHSSCAVPAVVGLADVVGPARPDPSQFDPASPYHDPRSERDNPRWVLRDIHYRSHLPRPLPLAELKRHAAQFEGFALLHRSRLSVMPVAPEHYRLILQLAATPGENA